MVITLIKEESISNFISIELIPIEVIELLIAVTIYKPYYIKVSIDLDLINILLEDSFYS